MNQITFLHCAGLNLGYGFKVSGYADAKKLTIRREDLKKVFAKILDIASYEKADFILISGKFIDTNNIDQATIEFINEKLSQYLDIQVVVLLEEDSKATTKAYKAIAENNNVMLLTSENNCISYENKSTSIYGINKDSKIDFTELLNDNGLGGAQEFKLLMSSIPISSFSERYSSIEPTRFLMDKGLNYLACGYSKNRINDELRDELVYNCGTPEPLEADEIGTHGIYSVTITKKDDGYVKKDIAFIETAIRCYYSVEVDISECFTQDAIKDVILNTVKPNLTDIYNVNLIGKVIPDLDYKNEKIADMLDDEFFDVVVSSDKVENYDIKAIILEPGIRGTFAKKLVDEINSTSNSKQKSILKKALFFGIHALDGRQIQL
jgi:exonuclease SbcD